MKILRNDERGIALFILLWILTLLSVMVGQFISDMRTELHITRNLKDSTRAYYMAKAGINGAIAELKGRQLAAEPARALPAGKAENATMSKVNPEMPPIIMGEDRSDVTIWNESGKININRAGGPLLKMMLNPFELDEPQKDVIVDSIMDWRDKDDLPRLNGAESDYYLSLPKPYKSKNGNFESSEELLLLKGVTPEIFYRGLKDLVTVYPPQETEPAKGYADQSKREFSFSFNAININAASYDMIRALPKMTDESAKAVIEYRSHQDFKSLTEVIAILSPEVYAAIGSYITLETLPFYTIQSRGTVEGAQTKHVVQALVKIDKKLRDGYQVIRWCDDLRYPIKKIENSQE